MSAVRRRCWPTSRWWTVVAGGTRTTAVEQRELEQWFLEDQRPMPSNCSHGSDTDGGLAGARADHAAQLDRPTGAPRSISTSICGRPAGDKISIFTTRVDTIFGCAASVQLAPEHPMVEELIGFRIPT